ncbi:MAG TPA: pilus assembly protein N-terminal domain-containing protein [Mesorhizobium sp.]|jgi:Flp pilus assembly secretin CpaC|nr:pilus assembly protein N-terminal domain-containing protein [Mesorhizobium sp.]
MAEKHLAACAWALAALASAACLSVPAHAEGGIAVSMNQAKIVKLARPADTIVVGNPLIADASVQDAHTIVLTGKGFGVTNLVVLDAEGAPVIDEQVIVSRHDASSVRIYRRAQVQTLSCTPFCESSYKNEAERMSEAEMSAGQ